VGSPFSHIPVPLIRELCCFAGNPLLGGGCICEDKSVENNLKEEKEEEEEEEEDNKKMIVDVKFPSKGKDFVLNSSSSENNSQSFFIPDYQNIHSMIHNEFPKIDILKITKFIEGCSSADMMMNASSLSLAPLHSYQSLLRLVTPELFTTIASPSPPVLFSSNSPSQLTFLASKAHSSLPHTRNSSSSLNFSQSRNEYKIKK
jgi:hypothetical protein